MCLRASTHLCWQPPVSPCSTSGHPPFSPHRARQEQAAVAGAVPFLCQLGILPQRGAVAAHAHGLAVSLLCALARGGARVRASYGRMTRSPSSCTCSRTKRARWRCWMRWRPGWRLTRCASRRGWPPPAMRKRAWSPSSPSCPPRGRATRGARCSSPLQRLLSLSPRMARRAGAEWAGATRDRAPAPADLPHHAASRWTCWATLWWQSPRSHERAAARFRLAQVLVPLAARRACSRRREGGPAPAGHTRGRVREECWEVSRSCCWERS